ncbi:MAG TPA: TetR/AcrR family transcriptional regulator C-terminal domain-containing protein [Gemmatimonadaceae bacterium]
MTRHGTDEVSIERRRAIVAAALALLDESGFDRLSLRRLAAHLEMHAPGLYWYIESKQELIDLMAKAILDEGFATVPPLAEGQSWEDWLVELACITRRTLLAHRDGARIVAGSYILRTGTLSPIIERALELLEAAGFERLVALGGTLTVLRYATGIALDEQASPLQPLPTATVDEQLVTTPLPPIDAAQFPRMADAMRRVFEGKLRNRERVFRWGAQLIVRGLAQAPNS